MNEKFARKVIDALRAQYHAHARKALAGGLLERAVHAEIANAICARIVEIQREAAQDTMDEFIAAIRAEIAQNAPPAGQ